MRPVLIAAALAAFLIPGQASAQMLARLNCSDTANLEKMLLEKYGEMPTHAGVIPNGVLFQLFSSEGGGTWTAVFTHPSNGKSCVIADGEGLREIEAKYPDPASWEM